MEFRKMVTITLYAKQKRRQMYRTDFWTLCDVSREQHQNMYII